MGTEAIAKYYLNQYVEIYMDHTHDTISYSDGTRERRALICGILKAVEDEWLVVEVSRDGDKNITLLNSGWVHTIMSPTKHISTLDLFVREDWAKKERIK